MAKLVAPHCRQYAETFRNQPSCHFGAPDGRFCITFTCSRGLIDHCFCFFIRKDDNPLPGNLFTEIDATLPQQSLSKNMYAPRYRKPSQVTARHFVIPWNGNIPCENETLNLCFSSLFWMFWQCIECSVFHTYQKPLVSWRFACVPLSYEAL